MLGSVRSAGFSPIKDARDVNRKIVGTGKNCSFKGGVHPTRVFVRRGSTAYPFSDVPSLVIKNPENKCVHVPGPLDWP